MSSQTIMNSQTIESVMIPMPHTVDAAEPVRVARQMMRDHAIRHLPVVAGRRIIGILSDRDVKLAVSIEKCVPEVFINDVCRTDPYTVSPSTPLSEVVAHMATQHIGSVIIENHGDVVGIFTATDACKVLGEMLTS